jgi:hypothetical protein
VSCDAAGMEDHEGWTPHNPYPLNPFRVTVYRALERRPVRSYYFLGGAPKGVLAAAKRGTPKARLLDPNRPGRWPATQWPEKDQEVLARHYGKGWQNLLVPDLSYVLRDPEVAAGGGSNGVALGGLVAGGDRCKRCRQLRRLELP